jgi:hypothetical protein
LSVGDSLELSYLDQGKTSSLIIGSGKDLQQGTVILAIVSLKALEAANGEFLLAEGSRVMMEVLGYALT